MAEPRRPHLLVGVAGTGTEVGKTWVAVELVRALQDRRLAVAARKPAQSFEPADATARVTDADLLAAATGEDDATVCPPARRYEVPMAPPMAADALGRGPVRLAELVAEVAASWPGRAPDIGLVELAGGVRSPMAHDGDGVALLAALAPDLVVVVADAGLGTINSVRLTLDALGAERPTVVHLNRFDASDDLHRRNLAWLAAEGTTSTTDVESLAALVDGALPRFCVDCGVRERDCRGGHGALEAPRYCPVCGRRMAVTIIPTGHRSVCRQHGEVL